LRTSIAAGPSVAHLCAAWLPAAASGKAASAAAAAAAAPAPTVLAVGTASGDVTAYDTATAEVRWRALSVNDGGVSCLAAGPAHAPPAHGGGGKRAAASAAASSSAARLVSCGADAVVASLDPATGEPAPFAPPEKQQQPSHHAGANGHAAAAASAPPTSSFRGSKHPVTALALSADGGRALVGATTLALWELAPSSSSSSTKPRRLAKLTGHPLPVRAAAFAPGPGHYALTAARGERGVSVWRASAGALQQQQQQQQGGKGGGSVVVAASASLPMDDEAVQLATCAVGGAGAAGGSGAFFAAAVGAGGECAVWRVQGAAAGGGGAGLEVTPQARVRVAGAASGGESILAAHLEPTAGEGERDESFFFFFSPGPSPLSPRSEQKRAESLFPPRGLKHILTREGGRNAARHRAS
jgi:hypothetical protein